MPDPWGSIAQAGVGLAQTIGGWIQQHKATKQLEKLKSPTYAPNQSILDYYNKALQRYNVSPYESAGYKRSVQDIGTGTTQGIDALNSRRSGLGGISNLVYGRDKSLLNADVAAENEQNQRFGVLGEATKTKAGEDKAAFQINQLDPFTRKYNLLAAKAAGGNQVGNAGISNLTGGLQGVDQYNLLKKYYGK